MNYTPEQLVAKLEDAITRMGDSEKEHDEWIGKFVESEADYRLAQAKAYGQTDGTVDERRHQMQTVTVDQAQAAHRSEWMVKSSLEKVRNRRAELTAIQSATNVIREQLKADQQDISDSVFS